MPSHESSDLPDEPLAPALQTDSEYEEHLIRLFGLHRIATPYDVMDALPQFFKYHNKTMRHLNRLANQGFLRRHDHEDGYVYNITNTGYERCRDIPNIDLLKLPYHYEEPTGKQVNHELLITQTAIAICQYIESQRPHVRLLDHGRFGLQNEPAFRDKVPDYWYLAADKNGLMFRIVEAVVGVESATAMRKMFEEYERWGQTDEVREFLTRLYMRWGAKEPKPEFQVHCILESSSWKHTDAWKERMTMMQTFHVPPMMQGRVWTTTKGAVEMALAEGMSINHPIWRRGRDLLEKRTQWDKAAKGTRTRLVDGFVRRMESYPLFA